MIPSDYRPACRRQPNPAAGAFQKGGCRCPVLYGALTTRRNKCSRRKYLSCDPKTATGPDALQGPRTPGSMFSLFLALFDQLPETGMLLELLIFAERQLRSVEKVTNGIFVEHTVDEDTFRTPLEIDPVIV